MVIANSSKLEVIQELSQPRRPLVFLQEAMWSSPEASHAKPEMIMRKLYIKRKDNEKVVDSRVKNKPFPSSKPAIVTRRVVS